MKRFSQQFKKQSENIRMRVSERNELKGRLLSYMEYHPLPKEMAHGVRAKASRMEGIVSEPFKVITFNKIYVRSFAGLFAVMLIVSVPFVAEHALPGDVLYPVKIQFNEQLRSTLTLSPYAKVQWETETLERRISEARLLASEGKLTPETETQVAQAVKDHADAAQKEIAQLRTSDSDGAAIAEIALSSALDVQSEVLSGSSDKNSASNQTPDGHSVAVLAQVVEQARDSVQAAQAESGTQPSYEKLLARIEQESTHVSELFASVKKEASDGEVSDVERSLADIQRKIDRANALRNGSASSSANTVITTLSSAIGTSSTSTETNIPDVGTTTVTTLSTLSMGAGGVSSTDSGSSTATTSTSTSVIDSDAESTSSASTTASRVATDLLRSALSDLQKVLSYLTNIDVRQNVSIKDLVPVTPTTEERVSEITKLYDDSRAIQTKVIGLTLDKDLQAKVSLGESELESDLSQVVAAVQNGDLDAALSLVTSAHTIAVDLDKLTSDIPNSTPGSSVAASSTATSSDQSGATDNADAVQ